MKISEAYLKYYQKSSPCLHKKYKLVNGRWIDLVFRKLKDKKSLLSRSTLCLYNPCSLTNVLRAYDNETAYLDEADKVTASFEELKSALFKLHRSMSKDCKAVVGNIAASQQVFAAEYPNADKSVYGLVGFEFVVDTSKHDAEHYAKALARKADLLNYNIVDFNIDQKDAEVMYEGKTYTLSRFDLQLEAAYQDKIDLKLGRYVYHVTTKNNAKKILKNGLLPRNSNQHGFRYPDRTYVFIDASHVMKLAKPYAKASKKQNKLYVKDDVLEKMLDQYNLIMKKLNGAVIDTREFAVLRVDLAKAGDIRLYRDNTFEIDGEFVAAYTEQAIKPDAVELVDSFAA